MISAYLNSTEKCCREEVTDIGEEIYISQDFNKAKGTRIQSAGENIAQRHNSFFNIFF